MLCDRLQLFIRCHGGVGGVKGTIFGKFAANCKFEKKIFHDAGSLRATNTIMRS
jgi:hypothetical protein